MAGTPKKKAVIPLDYGNALRQALKDKHVTTTKLADSLKMDNGSISKYCTGQQLPPFVTYKAIDAELGIDLSKQWKKVLPFWEKYLQERKKTPPDGKSSHKMVLTRASEIEVITLFRLLNRKGHQEILHMLRAVADTTDYRAEAVKQKIKPA